MMLLLKLSGLACIISAVISTSAPINHLNVAVTEDNFIVLQKNVNSSVASRVGLNPFISESVPALSHIQSVNFSKELPQITPTHPLRDRRYAKYNDDDEVNYEEEDEMDDEEDEMDDESSDFDDYDDEEIDDAPISPFEGNNDVDSFYGYEVEGLYDDEY